MLDYDPYAALGRLKEFPALALSSTDVADGEPLPKAQWRAAMGGQDVSPQLSWSGFPPETASFAVSVFDPDAPTGSGYWHWSVFGIPAAVTELASGAGTPGSGLLPAGAVTLRNEEGEARFLGAGPPPRTGTHRYFIVVTALDVAALDIPEGASPAILGFNAHFHGIARGILVPTASSD